MANRETNNIIFTKDENYAYRLRSKLMNADMKLDYIGNAEGLLYYLFNNTKGIILIDLKYARFASIINEYANNQFSRNFCFVYLTDNKSCEIAFDNEITFVANCDNLMQTMSLAYKSLEKREREKFFVPDDFVDEYSIKMLNNLNISPKHAGYEMIKDAIRILVNKDSYHFNNIKEVYEEISISRDKNISNIEKCIRLALSKAEEKEPNVFKNEFNDEHISNSILLTRLAERIRCLYLSLTKENNK